MKKKETKQDSSSSSSSSDSSSSDSDSSSDSSEDGAEQKKRKKAERQSSKTKKTKSGGGGAGTKVDKAAKAKAATKIQSVFRGRQTRKKDKQNLSPNRSVTQPTAKGSKAASPRVTGKKDQAATKIQSGSLVRGRPKSTSPTGRSVSAKGRSASPTWTRKASLFSQIDTNKDGMVTRSDFKKALSSGVLDGIGMKEQMHALEEETQKLRQMLAEVSPSPGGVTNASTTASSIPRLDLKALHHTPTSTKATGRPPRPKSAPKSLQKTKKKKKPDEDVLQDWLMEHLDSPEKQQKLVRQFRDWATPKKKKLRPYGRSKSSSPPRKTSPGGWGKSAARSPSPDRKTSPERKMKALPQRSLSADGASVTFANHRASSADAPHRRSPDSNRKRKQGHESDWSDSKSPRSESVERWTRWKKPHERETFEIVAEFGVLDIGFAHGSREDGSVLVDEVVFGSWAWRKGVEEGDQLLEIDDKKVSDLTEAQVRWAMMRRPVRLAFLSNLSRNGKGDRSLSPDAKGKGKSKKGRGKGKTQRKGDDHVHVWGTDLAKATPRNWNKVMKGQARRTDSELVHMTPDDVIRFEKSPLTAALTGSFKIINCSGITVAYKVKTSAPKNYHLVQPTRGVLVAKKTQAVKIVFKPRGCTDMLQPEYSIVVQVTKVDEHEGLEKFDELERNPMLDLAKNPVVEEHRLLVIFEDADRDRPVDLSNTGVLTHGDTSFACPSRMNVSHAETLEKRDQWRKDKRQEKIDEFENTIKWPTKRATSAELLSSSQRLHDEAKKKWDKRGRSIQDKIAEEMKSITTIYNNSSMKFSEVGNERFDRITRDFWRQKESHAKERRKNEEEEYKKIEDKNLHLNLPAAKGAESTDRLYQEALERIDRKQDRVDQELRRQDDETTMYSAAPGTVNVDELMEKLLKDGAEVREKRKEMQKEAIKKINQEACRGNEKPDATRQSGALRHAHALSSSWKKHERFRHLLQARYQEAEVELLKHESVGHEVPDNWIQLHGSAKVGLDAMVARLFPHQDVSKKKEKTNEEDSFSWSDGEASRSEPVLIHGHLIDGGAPQALPRSAPKRKAMAKPVWGKPAKPVARQIPDSGTSSRAASRAASRNKRQGSNFEGDNSSGDAKARSRAPMGRAHTPPRTSAEARSKPLSPRLRRAVTEEEHQAAAKIQALYRGNKVRKTLEFGDPEDLDSPRSDLLSPRQPSPRPALAVKVPRSQLTDEEIWWRHHEAALRIQKHTRGMLERKKAEAQSERSARFRSKRPPVLRPVVPKLVLPSAEGKTSSPKAKAEASKLL